MLKLPKGNLQIFRIFQIYVEVLEGTRKTGYEILVHLHLMETCRQFDGFLMGTHWDVFKQLKMIWVMVFNDRLLWGYNVALWVFI